MLVIESVSYAMQGYCIASGRTKGTIVIAWFLPNPKINKMTHWLLNFSICSREQLLFEHNAPCQDSFFEILAEKFV